MPTTNFTVMKAMLSADPFAFLDDQSSPYNHISGFKPRNSARSAKMYHFLENTVPTLLGHSVTPLMIKTLCVIIDNETGFRSVREGGFAFNDVQRKRIIKDSLYLAFTNQPRYGNRPLEPGSAEYRRQYLAWKPDPTRPRPNASLIDSTMESDCVKFRGTFWIQLTFKGNFAATGDTAYNLRKMIPGGNPNVLATLQKFPKLSELDSVHIDIMSVDPMMNLLVLLVFLTQELKSVNEPLSSRVSTLNRKSVSDTLAKIGYDNDIKKEFSNVPSLTEMIKRVTNFKLLTKKNKDNEKPKPQSPDGSTQRPRKFKFTRSIKS